MTQHGRPATDADALTEAQSEAAHVLALSRLPGMGPARLMAIVTQVGSAIAWSRIRAGAMASSRVLVHGGLPASLLAAWSYASQQIDVAYEWQRHQAAGVQVVVAGEEAYPAVLVGDPAPPALLCAQGDLTVTSLRRVAVVGTRRATRYGVDVARRLGAELAEAGVSVVSGLALGIDGAAHEGALAPAGAAPPIAVVAGGLDVVYPQRHRDLWRQVRERGLVCTEAPLGTQTDPWRFPARNRIIAALAEAVVVVESPERGGSMLTVDEALARDRPVLAVPGAITAASSVGTNRLIHAGAFPVLDTADVLAAIGVSSQNCSTTPIRAEPTGEAGRVLEAIAHEPVSLEQVAAIVNVPPQRLAGVLSRLEAEGWLTRSGAWFQRCNA